MPSTPPFFFGIVERIALRSGEEAAKKETKFSPFNRGYMCVTPTRFIETPPASAFCLTHTHNVTLSLTHLHFGALFPAQPAFRLLPLLSLLFPPLTISPPLPVSLSRLYPPLSLSLSLFLGLSPRSLAAATASTLYAACSKLRTQPPLHLHRLPVRLLTVHTLLLVTPSSPLPVLPCPPLIRPASFALSPTPIVSCTLIVLYTVLVLALPRT